MQIKTWKSMFLKEVLRGRYFLGTSRTSRRGRMTNYYVREQAEHRLRRRQMNKLYISVNSNKSARVINNEKQLGIHKLMISEMCISSTIRLKLKKTYMLQLQRKSHLIIIIF